MPSGATVTVYHFGFSEDTGVIRTHLYQSTSGFASEMLEYGVGVKPMCNVPENYTFPNDIKRMMDEQREIQSSKPIIERVYIGGEIQIHHLTLAGISIYSLDKFADFSSDEQAIFENYEIRKNESDIEQIYKT
jgi:hypothetical protein